MESLVCMTTALTALRRILILTGNTALMHWLTRSLTQSCIHSLTSLLAHALTLLSLDVYTPT